jgi:hypothetical protein
MAAPSGGGIVLLRFGSLALASAAQHNPTALLLPHNNGTFSNGVKQGTFLMVDNKRQKLQRF